MKRLKGARLWKDQRPLKLQYGGELPEVEVAYETWGKLAKDRSNAILICPAFSAHSHARSSERDPSPGWWEEMIGPERAFDTDRFFVICASLLGGCYGTSGPRSIDPRSGRRYGPRFPIVTVRDIVDVHMRLLDRLGIEKLHAVAGGSLGGMESMDLAARYPGRAERAVSISATARTRPFTATIRHIGRRAIIEDPAFEAGEYGDRQPVAGLRLARELGTIYYRSRREFNQRFSCDPMDEAAIRIEAINFDFESYLRHQGRKAPKLFDANTYLRLSMAMDLYDLTRGFESLEEALGATQARFFVAGCPEDLLIPMDEQTELHEALRRIGKQSRWGELRSLFGHDAFLKEFGWMTPRIREFLDE